MHCILLYHSALSLYHIALYHTVSYCIVSYCTIVHSLIIFFSLVFIRSSPDIRWKCYKNTANNRTKKEKIEIYENRKLSVIKVGIELTTNGKKKY